MMKTIKITKADLDSENYYKEDGIGCVGSDEDASIEIAGDLGWVKFKKGIYVTGSIVSEAGSGIKAGSGIEAGWGIKAGSGIKAGWGIEAGWGIVSLYSWIKAKLSINFNSSCTISAGIFSTSGEKEIEAQEIIGGKMIYGKVNLLPKEVEEKEVSLSGKKVTVEIDGKKYAATID